MNANTNGNGTPKTSKNFSEAFGEWQGDKKDT